MREQLEQLLIVLAVGSVVAIGAKRVDVPYNVALVVVGLLLVLLNVLPETPMDPEIVLIVFLPILVFQGALSADSASMRRAARPILALAVPGVALSLLVTAAIAAWEIGLPFSVALLLGAVLAITDTVSVLLAFRSVRVPHRLAAIMEGESLFNDGTALVLVGLAATVVMRGSADPVEIARMLVIAIVAGAFIGAASGTLGARVLRRAPDELTAILASIVTVFATSLLTEHLGGSAVIAVVLAGVWIGHEMRAGLEPSRVLALQEFWEVAAFILNVWLFLLVGMQLTSELLLREAWPIVLAVIALHAGRAVAVYGCLGVLRLAGSGVPWRWQHVMVFGNVKGALSMAAVLTLPQGIPYRDRLVAIVFGVTLVTLVVQALPLPALPDLAGRGDREGGRTGRRVPGDPGQRPPRPDGARQPAGVRPRLAPRPRRGLGDVPARDHRGRALPAPGAARRAWQPGAARGALRAEGRDSRRRAPRPHHGPDGRGARRRPRRADPANRSGRAQRRRRGSAMKIVIAGAGRAGLEVATHLTRIGHAVTIIDVDEAVIRRASEQLGLVALTGDATIAEVLEEADIAQSEVVVGMLRRDADNLAVALLSRAAGVERVMVRMRDNAYRRVYAAAGIDRILSETDLITGSVATAIEHDAIRHAMLLSDGSAVAFELTVQEGSAAAGRTIMDLAALPGFPSSCVFAALYRADGQVEAPRGATIVQRGTTVLLVSRADEVGRVVKALTEPVAG